MMVDERDRLIAAMAAELHALKIFHSERAAIRALAGRYRFGDIALLVDDVLVEARQAAVADIMAAPEQAEPPARCEASSLARPSRMAQKIAEQS